MNELSGMRLQRDTLLHFEGMVLFED